MLDIIKRIAIGVAIAMCVFFLKSNVFALTVDSRYQITEPSVNGSYVSAGTIMQYNNTSSAYQFGSVFVRFAQTYLPDTIYRVSFQYRVDNNFYTLHHTCPDSYSLTSGFELISASCSEIGNRVAQFEVSFKTPDSSSSYATIGLKYAVIFAKNYSTAYQVMSDSWSIENVDSTYEAILNNTTVIGNAIDGISNFIDFQTAVIESLRDMVFDIQYAMFTEEQVEQWQRESVASVVSSETATLIENGHSAGSSGIGSSGELGFNLDPFTAPFSFIFDKVESFLSINATFFLYLINMITLGFIGLVLNR